MRIIPPLFGTARGTGVSVNAVAAVELALGPVAFAATMR